EGWCSEAARFQADDLLGQGAPAKVWYRYRFIGQPVMDTQLLFWLGNAAYGATDVGEVLDTATRIDPGDERSWFEAWCATAARLERFGDAAAAAGHPLSAASHFQRAGSYYRAGLMRYADRADPRIGEVTRAGLALHDRALSLRGVDSAEVAIPYAGSSLFGRVYYAPGVDRAPFLVVCQGLHAWPEDVPWVWEGALRRGYHVLTFHGPGQGASLRLGGLVFRPDWENVVAPVLDFAQTLPRLQPDRAVLMGLSMGGYLAPRAAAHEPRLYALVADPGVVDWGGRMLAHFEDIPGLLALHAQGPAAFDRAIDAASLAMPDARWYFDDVTWKHGVASPHAFVDAIRDYVIDDPGAIRCKTLILDGTAEDATPGESQRLHDAVGGPKWLVTFDPDTAAQTHCQGGATLLAEARLFDWLDEEVRPTAG
ncbi:MAG: alpha/beta hydrolase, partial [Myxococcota bacterium]